MATSYQELRRRLALQIDRDDAHDQVAYDGTVIDQLDNFILNAERRFYRDKVARIPPLEFFLDYTVPAGETIIPIPEGYFELRYAELTTASNIRYNLERTSIESVNNGPTDVVAEVPNRIAYGSNNFHIDQANADVSVRIYYYGTLTSLKDIEGETTTHWLLNQADDLILYWAAYDASLYYGDVGDPAMWEKRAMEIRNSIIEQETRQRQSGSTPRIGRHYRNPPKISPNRF